MSDATAAWHELTGKGARVLREPVREPWGPVEMWVAAPDGVRLCVVEVPADPPLRHRPGI